jgi:xylulose-5-phosphate/fructose-6-phosphate phosphoketolase
LGNIDIDQDLSASIEWALDEIHKIQTTARTGNPVTKPRRRCLFFVQQRCHLTIPWRHSRYLWWHQQGWGAWKSFHGQVIEGSFHAHQVPPPGTKKDPEQFALLSSWLSSYKPYELFDEDGSPQASILKIISQIEEKRLGRRNEANTDPFPLNLPDWRTNAVEKNAQQSCTETVGDFLADAIAMYVKILEFCFN